MAQSKSTSVDWTAELSASGLRSRYDRPSRFPPVLSVLPVSARLPSPRSLEFFSKPVSHWMSRETAAEEHMPHLSEKTILYAPASHPFREGEISFFLDEAAPHWIAVDERGGEILRVLDGRRTFGDLVSRYASERKLEAGKAWLHVHDFLQACLRASFLSLTPFERPPYEGRERYASPNGLHELWLHTNNSCNLACTHCLVNSGPGETPGLPSVELKRVIAEALAMGVERFYMTGGEPFLRPDIYELIRLITEENGRELIVLTNATLFRGPRGEGLGSL
jgi:hypothetical protein